MKNKLLVFFLIVLLALEPTKIKADELPVQIVGSTQPVSAEIKAAVLFKLQADPPADTPYYGITGVSQYEDGYAVSVAALSANKTEEDGWYLGDLEFEWLGSFHVFETSEGLQAEYLYGAPRPYKLASPKLAAGGSKYVALPISNGSCAIYGSSGVTAAGYGSYGSGMVAIDLIVGQDLGSHMANFNVFASGGGDGLTPETVHWVCYSENVTMLQTSFGGLVPEYIYGNLKPGNIAHVIGHDYSKLETIGEIQTGTFDGSDGIVNCGSANQDDYRGVLRWGFFPKDNYFETELYQINTKTSVIYFEETTINPGEMICSYAGWQGSAWNTPTGRVQTGVANFFDLVVVGIDALISVTIEKSLPDHNSSMGEFLITTSNAAKILFRIAYVMFRGQISLQPIVVVAGFWATIFTVWGIVKIILLILRFIRLVLLR
jgi:hypothetical protein